MQPNLAYRFVAMMLMLAEANFFCGKTGLHDGPFAYDDIRQGSRVSLINPKGVGGSILTDKYFFGFGWGHLANYYKRGFMPQKPDSAIRERNLELSKFKSVIDTNGAWELATNWLAKLDVNVPALETKYRRKMMQWRYYPQGEGGPVVMLPVFQAEWHGKILRSQPNQERAAVALTVFGATKELLEYHVYDDSLFSRPALQIKGRDKLLSISEAEFGTFDATKRSNLVLQFTGTMTNAAAGF